MVEYIPTSVYFLINIRVRKVPPLLALSMGGSSGVFFPVAPRWQKKTRREIRMALAQKRKRRSYADLNRDRWIQSPEC